MEENEEEELLRSAALKNANSILLARQRAEEALHKQSEWLRITLASIGDAVISTDPAGRVTLLNGVAEALTGWPQAEAIGRPLSDVFHIINEDTRQPVENPVLQTLREGTVVGLANHTILIARNGTERPIADSAAPIRDSKGNVAGVVLVFRDVTEQRRAEQADRKNREILLLVHKVGKIGYWEWNSLTGENKWSPEIEALYGLPPGGFEGSYHGWAKLLHPDDLAKAEADLKHAWETGEYFTEFRVVWPDGSVHWLETRANVFKDDQGKPVRLVGVNMDVTERKRVEEELRQSQRELQERIEQLAETDRRKNEFLAMLAHELRNPLAPIRNSLQLLRFACPNPQDQVGHAFDIIERQIEHLVRLVDDLLDVSRITNGKIKLQKERVDLAAVIARAVESARPLIDARRHNLEVRLPDDALTVVADPVRLAQVLWNLLNNAAKYTPAGGRIWLTAVREQSDAVVRVRDTGLGIPAEMLPRVFDLFTQMERTLARAEGGLGIGLTLVRRLTEMHDGRVEAFSGGPGQGSEFVVRLPLAAAAAAKPADFSGAARRAGPASGKRILVVEDNQDAAESLAMLLRLYGNDVRTAHDGRLALEVAGAYRPDAVLLDIGLPGMDGLEVCRRLRTQSKKEEQPLIVAMTGYGQEEDRRRSEEAGFNAHMVKPVDLEALQELLSRPERVRRGPG